MNRNVIISKKRVFCYIICSGFNFIPAKMLSTFRCQQTLCMLMHHCEMCLRCSIMLQVNASVSWLPSLQQNARYSLPTWTSLSTDHHLGTLCWSLWSTECWTLIETAVYGVLNTNRDCSLRNAEHYSRLRSTAVWTRGDAAVYWTQERKKLWRVKAVLCYLTVSSYGDTMLTCYNSVQCYVLL